jgi:peptidoglycan DL-endopeptidase LytE
MKFIISCLILSLQFGVFAQENYIKHTIEKGENISRIARKYNVKSEDIFKINPAAKGILKLKSVLLIPNQGNKDFGGVAEKSNPNAEKLHEIMPKETLYGISKQYGVALEALQASNPNIATDGLRIGQKIVIPNNNIIVSDKTQVTDKPIEVAEKSIPAIVVKEKEIETPKLNLVHEVRPKETKYGIAKQYGITIEQLEIENPSIANGLLVGNKLNIKKNIEDPNNLATVNTTTTQIADNNTAIEAPQSSENVALVNETVAPVANDSISFVRPVANSAFLDQLVKNASENIGSRYRTGGSTKAGFDCSGLMLASFGSLDVKLPRTSREQSKLGIKVNLFEAQKGDLIFFSTNGSGNVNHVGMVVEVLPAEVKFIHASVHSGVIISSTNESYYKKSFVRINRILDQSLVASSSVDGR